MVLNTYITTITSATTVSPYSDTYLVTAGTGFNITLPPITADGIYYSLIREDTSSNVVGITGSNIIYQNLGASGSTGSGVTGNINLIPQTNLILQSYNNAWYILLNTSTQRSGQKILFSSAFVANSGNPLALSAGAGNTGTVCYFAYSGSLLEVISSAEVVITNGSASNIGKIQLWNYGTGPINQICSIDIPTSTTIRRQSTSVISNLSPVPTVIAVQFVGTGTGSSAMGLYSLVVK